MTTSDSQPQPRFLRDLFITALFNCGIAIFLSLLISDPFYNILIRSQAIGLSICTLAHAWVRLFGQLGITPMGFFISIPLGAAVGIGISNGILGWPLLPSDNNILIATALIALVFGSIVSYYFYSRQQLAEAHSQIQKESLQRLKNEQQLTNANLKLLQAQIEPHFLFNTLSTVVALIDTQPANARSMLESFTHYLRIGLNRTREGESTLGDELSLLTAYLDIQKIRMGERLNYTLDVPDALHGLALPPLLIQPLVENAITHGLESKVGGGHIMLSVRQHAHQLTVDVIDDGIGFDDTHPPGVALNNVRQRLQQLYGSEAQLRLSPNQPSGLCAQLTLPVAS